MKSYIHSYKHCNSTNLKCSWEVEILFTSKNVCNKDWFWICMRKVVLPLSSPWSWSLLSRWETHTGWLGRPALTWQGACWLLGCYSWNWLCPRKQQKNKLCSGNMWPKTFMMLNCFGSNMKNQLINIKLVQVIKRKKQKQTFSICCMIWSYSASGENT